MIKLIQILILIFGCLLQPFNVAMGLYVTDTDDDDPDDDDDTDDDDNSDNDNDDDDDTNLDNPEDVTKQLKKILPALLKAKKILNASKDNIAVVKEMDSRIKNIEGSIITLDKKYVQLGKKRVEVKASGLSKDEKIDFAKFMISIFKVQKRGSTNEKYHKAIKEIYEKYPCKALQEGTDSEGGYLVPELFLDTIWRAAEQASIALKDAMIMPLTTGYKLPVLSLSSGVSVSWVNEEGAVPSSDPAFAKASVEAKKLMAYTRLSNELLEDEEVGLTDLLVTLYGEAIGAEIDNQAFNGTGSPFTGVLQASGTNSVTMAVGEGKFSDVDADDLSDMISLIKPSVLAGAKYYMHRTIFNHVRKLKTTTGEYIYQMPAGDVPATIWGYPFELAEQMPANSASAVDTPFIFFGNMKFFLIGTKGAMTVKTTDILNLLTDQTDIVVRRRLAEVVALASAFTILKTNAVDS
jgi:HK97 family phage major capsid protein